MQKFDYIIVGAGLFGSVFAQQCKEHNKSVLIIDKRDHIGGNCFTKKIYDIDIHVYGPHIFHTNSKNIWDYVNNFIVFDQYVYSPVAKNNNKIYSLPFNMWTYYQLWGVTKPQDAKQIIDSQKYTGNITNLEDQAKALVGEDIYNLLIKDYTTKQWNTNPRNLPASIIKRLPVRYEFNNNYFNDIYQGIPRNGYTELFEKLLDNIEIELNTNYFTKPDYYNSLAKNVVYTGPIDTLFDYCYGHLEYRSLNFEHETYHSASLQGCAVINHTGLDVEYTRSIEHKFFKSNITNSYTVLTKEYPANYNKYNEPYYPVNTNDNQNMFLKYQKLSKNYPKIILGGRLAEYKYYNMDQIIGSALNCFNRCIYN